MNDVAEIRHFFSKAVGVIHPNADGRNRQEVVAACRRFERLRLRHEPRNPKDSNAVAVLRQDGQKLGYLSAPLAKEVVRQQRAGYHYAAVVSGLTGGCPGKENRGVNLAIIEAAPEVTAGQLEQYVDQLAAELKAERQREATRQTVVSAGC